MGCKAMQKHTNATIGARLREERTRLGLNQADFAALAGAKKGAQLKWEKDESSPTGTFLAEFAQSGVDVMYVLTGKRGASLTPGAVPDFLEATSIVEEAHRLLEHARAVPLPDDDNDTQRLRQTLEAIATASQTPEKMRAECDMLLKTLFDDAAADERAAKRWRRVVAMSKAAVNELTRLESELNWEPPELVHHTILTLHTRHNFSPDELIDLLQVWRASIEVPAMAN